MSTILSRVSTTRCVENVLRYILEHELEPCKVVQATHVVTISDVYLEPHLDIERKTVETGEMGFFKGNVMKKVIQGYRQKTQSPAFFYQFSGEVSHLTTLNMELTAGKSRVIVLPERGTDVFVPYSELNLTMRRMQNLRPGEWSLSIDDNANSLYKTPEGLFFYSNNHDQYPVFSQWRAMGALYCNRTFTKYGVVDTKSDFSRVRYAKIAFSKGEKLDLTMVSSRYRGACRRASERFQMYKTEENREILACLEDEIVESILNQCEARSVKHWDRIKIKIRAAMVLCWLVRGREPTDLESVMYTLGSRFMCSMGIMRRTTRGIRYKGSARRRFEIIRKELLTSVLYKRVKKRKKKPEKGFLPLDFCNFLRRKEAKVMVRNRYLERVLPPPMGITPKKLEDSLINMFLERMYKELKREDEFDERINQHRERLRASALREHRNPSWARGTILIEIDAVAEEFLNAYNREQREKRWAEEFEARRIAALPVVDHTPPAALNTNTATHSMFQSMKFKRKTRAKKTKK